MWYIITAVIIVGGALFTGLFGCANQSKSVGNNTDSNQTLFDTIKGMFSKQQIKEKLEALSNSPAPDVLKNGAMCYKVAAPPNRTEYVCPVCGERTVHTDNMARFIERELPVCRTLADSISGIELALDEKSFCKKCSPEVKDPSLCIKTKFAGETTENTLCDIDSDDMQLLYEFMKGKLTHKDDYDNETPLKNYMERLNQLLGVTIK
ncbi:MAG: hypothetical protein V1904_00635 [Bacteroidota bacterium]